MTTYIPTSTSPQLVIQSLNDSIGQELSLPGNWSPTIFFNDLHEYPVKNKKELAKIVLDSCQKNTNYLEFFEKSRGKPRPCNDKQIKLWNIFSNGSVMLYFESTFLKLHNEEYDNDILILYLNALSQTPISHWDEVLKGIGACCYQWFIKEPELYTRLPYRKNMNVPEDMTDQELFDAIESSLSPTSYRGKISVDDSRSQLIERYKFQIC
jgi:hypothetical protein